MSTALAERPPRPPAHERARPARLGDLRGLGRAPAARADRARVPLPHLPAALRPRRAPGAARRRAALVGARGRAPARFRRSDYLGDPSVPLADAARDLVAERTGRRPTGPVRLLANPRYWGVGFNPVAFYYLWGDDAACEAMIAEVTNTPWGERRSYVLEAGAGRARRRASTSGCTSRRSCRWSRATSGRASEPGERLVGLDPQPRRRAAATSSRRRWRCGGASSRPRRCAGCSSATRR